MRLLAVDPSLACSGYALFDNGVFERAGVVSTLSSEPLPVRIRACSATLSGVDYDQLVIEWPQIYPHARGKGQDPNDLLCVAGVVGAILGETWRDAEYIKLVHPADWKGQVPKKIHNARVLQRLSAEERTRLPDLPASKLHNAIDAIGLGLWYLKRSF